MLTYTSRNEKDKFVLNPYLKIILCNEDEILVKHGVRSNFSLIIKDEKRTRLLGKIIKNFKTPSLVEDLISKEIIKKEEINNIIELINSLFLRNVLIDPKKDLIDVYFNSIFSKETLLSKYTLGIIGVGYLGFRVLNHLLTLGVKNINFCDERKIKNIEVENKFFDINIKERETYVKITKDYLSSKGIGNFLSFESKLDNEEDIFNIFKTSDFVILCLEFFSPKIFHTINKVGIQTKKPWALVYIDGSEGMIGPIIIPGETACYNELEIQREACIGFKDEYLLYKEYLEDERVNVPCAILPMYLNVISNWASILISRFLINKDPTLLEKCIFVNFEDLSLDFATIMKLPRCPACHETKVAYKHSFV